MDDSFNQNVVYCKKCTHIQLEKFPDKKELESYYETTYSESRDIADQSLLSWYETRAISQLDYISQFLNMKNEIGSVCDIGCGYGVFLQKCSAYVQNVNGYEIDPLCIEYCTKQGLNVNIIDNYGNTCFDLTTMSHLLEHIPDIVDLLARVKSRTRYLFIEIPATDVTYPFANSGHVHFFSEKSISKILQSLGFKILDVSRWGPSFNEQYRHYYFKKFTRHCKFLYDCCKYFYKKINNTTQHNTPNKNGVWLRSFAVIE
jgi:SAM-dependent methyltransferase